LLLQLNGKQEMRTSRQRCEIEFHCIGWPVKLVTYMELSL